MKNESNKSRSDKEKKTKGPQPDKGPSYHPGSTTQGGSDFGQGSSNLGAASYKQGSTRNDGANYNNEDWISDDANQTPPPLPDSKYDFSNEQGKR
jgi:hypothetical protein